MCERESVCVCEKERERERVCVCAREREGERVCVCERDKNMVLNLLGDHHHDKYIFICVRYSI